MKNSYMIVDDIVIIYVQAKGVPYECLISKEDMELVTEFPNTWCLMSEKALYVYGIRTRERNLRERVFLHRLIMQPPDDLVVDHINHNPLDNRRENLRVVTQTENLKHKKYRDKELPWGIKRLKETGQYKLVIVTMKPLNKSKRHELGVYKTISEAVSIRDKFVNENLRLFQV